MLLFYAFNYLKIKIDLDFGNMFPFPDQSTYVNVSVYDLLANGPSEVGNMIVLLAFLVTLALLTISILIFVMNDMTQLIKVRKILSISEVSLWVLMALMFIANIQFAAILIPLLAGANLFGLLKLEQLQQL